MTKFSDYLHTAAASEYVGVAHNNIRKWAARGDVPIHRSPVNGCRLFKRSDQYTFLKKTARPIKVIK